MEANIKGNFKWTAHNCDDQEEYGDEVVYSLFYIPPNNMKAYSLVQIRKIGEAEYQCPIYRIESKIFGDRITYEGACCYAMRIAEWMLGIDRPIIEEAK